MLVVRSLMGGQETPGDRCSAGMESGRWLRLQQGHEVRVERQALGGPGPWKFRPWVCFEGGASRLTKDGWGMPDREQSERTLIFGA